MDLRVIEPLTPEEFLIAHRAKVMEAQKDGCSMAAITFRRKYGIAPKDYHDRMKHLRELAGRRAAADLESQATMRVFAMMWSGQSDK